MKDKEFQQLLESVRKAWQDSQKELEICSGLPLSCESGPLCTCLQPSWPQLSRHSVQVTGPKSVTCTCPPEVSMMLLAGFKSR
jgi:hypothetical protein